MIQSEGNFCRDNSLISKAEFKDKVTNGIILEAFFVPYSISKFPTFDSSKQKIPIVRNYFFVELVELILEELNVLWRI